MTMTFEEAMSELSKPKYEIERLFYEIQIRKEEIPALEKRLEELLKLDPGQPRP